MRFKPVCAAALLLGTFSLFAQKPPVVLITLDTFRADRLAAFGGNPALAPALNGLAARARLQTACFTPAPLTLPAHAAMLTGCLPSRAGLRDNGFGKLAPGVQTIAELFAAAGYRTEAVVASSVLDSQYGLSRGFAFYDDSIGPTHFRSGAEVTDRALQLLSAKDARPLFLWAHYFDAHEPYLSPPSFSGRGQSAYDRAVAYLDSEVSRLLAALPSDATIVVASDHGEALGDHGEETHGILLYQPTVYAVLLFAGPKVRSEKDARPCSLADLAPTLASLVGVGPFKECDGMDLLAKNYPATRQFPLETMLPFDVYRWLPLFGVTDGRYKWVRGATDRLYDLQSDPGETKDLAFAPPKESLALRAALRSFQPTGVPDAVDRGLRGLGYAPVPGEAAIARALPDPENRLDVMALLRRAQSLRTGGELQKAAEFYGEAVRKDEGNPSARFDLGETQRRMGEYDKALKRLDEALALAPKMAAAWTSKGLALVSLGKADEAAPCFRKALSIEPRSVEAINALSAYLLDKNQPAEALPLIERAVGEGVANTRTYLLRGRVRLVQGKDDEAKRDFTSAMMSSPDPAATLNEEADIYMILRKFSEGVTLYQEGMARFPNYAPNYLTLASYFVQADAPERALPLYRKALQCDLDQKTRKQVEELVQEIAPEGVPKSEGQ